MYLWSLKSLFSKGALKRLESESKCAEINSAKKPRCTKKKFREFNGECNNLKNRLFGASATPFLRLVGPKYFDSDGLNDPIGYPGQSIALLSTKPTTFDAVGGTIVEQNQPERLNTPDTHALMQFGQFLDHDLDLAPEIENSRKCANVRYDISSL